MSEEAQKHVDVVEKLLTLQTFKEHLNDQKVWGLLMPPTTDVDKSHEAIEARQALQVVLDQTIGELQRKRDSLV